jgi:hypothetical protein
MATNRFSGSGRGGVVQERAGMGMPGMGLSEMATRPASLGMGVPAMSTMAGMSTGANWLMVPRCAFKVEKFQDGLKIICSCDDVMTSSMLQNLCSMLAGSMYGCCCVMNGTMVWRCNFTMALCKCEMTKDGVIVICSSGDPDCSEMIRAYCDCLSAMLKSGCICYLLMSNLPVCCGDDPRSETRGGSVPHPDHKQPRTTASPQSPAVASTLHGENPSAPAPVSLAGKRAHSSPALEDSPMAQGPSSSSIGSSAEPHVGFLCAVWEIREDAVRCLVDMNGAILPVAFPKSALLPHQGLRENFKFFWTMKDAEHIQPEDISPVFPRAMTRAELDELLRRTREALADPANDVWDDLNKE